ncbi:PGPGW domain-containing protein [Roseomonas sp. BN140053]|uniref:PGPGW domain-containing protein n=1 Tax=Roseomonas sp. BN140053 TaxID=3391898 RepID=UPI0039E895A8
MDIRPSATRKAIGWSLLVLGVLGCVLPFLQGFLFLALGVFVLRDQHAWAARGWGWLAQRWPGAVARVEAMEEGLTRRLSDWGRRARRMLGRA